MDEENPLGIKEFAKYFLEMYLWVAPIVLPLYWASNQLNEARRGSLETTLRETEEQIKKYYNLSNVHLEPSDMIKGQSEFFSFEPPRTVNVVFDYGGEQFHIQYEATGLIGEIPEWELKEISYTTP